MHSLLFPKPKPEWESLTLYERHFVAWNISEQLHMLSQCCFQNKKVFYLKNNHILTKVTSFSESTPKHRYYLVPNDCLPAYFSNCWQLAPPAFIRTPPPTYLFFTFSEKIWKRISELRKSIKHDYMNSKNIYDLLYNLTIWK